MGILSSSTSKFDGLFYHLTQKLITYLATHPNFMGRIDHAPPPHCRDYEIIVTPDDMKKIQQVATPGAAVLGYKEANDLWTFGMRLERPFVVRIWPEYTEYLQSSDDSNDSTWRPWPRIYLRVAVMPKKEVT